MDRLKDKDREGAHGELMNFFYLSYRFSQNELSLQYDFFKWAAAKGKFKGILMEGRDLSSLNVPKLHREVDAVAAQKEFEKQWAEMRKIFGSSNLTPINYVKSAAIKLIGLDAKYQEIKRPKRKGSDASDSQTDPHASYVRKFILGGHPTGSGIFDQLFDDIKEELNSETYKVELSLLAGAWERNHPREKFFVEK